MRYIKLAAVAAIGVVVGAVAIGPLTADEPTGEAIAVHGDWTITVTDPDTGASEVHEFSNALTAEGAATLEGLLDRVSVANPATDSDVCSVGQFDNGGTCLDVIVDSLDFNFGYATSIEVGFVGGTSSVVEASVDGNADFEATFAAAGDSTIEWVATNFAEETTVGHFTYKTLDAPIDVLAGQEVTIVVDISFG